jgi:hypothetical protein
MGVVMTTMQQRLRYEEETDEPAGFDLQVQLDDDDFFEPTIVRGRE